MRGRKLHTVSGPSADLRWFTEGFIRNNAYGTRRQMHESYGGPWEPNDLESGHPELVHYQIIRYLTWGGSDNNKPYKDSAPFNLSFSLRPGEPSGDPDIEGPDRGFTYHDVGWYRSLEEAKQAALRHHVAHHYGLRPLEQKAVEWAWPSDGVMRFHGQQPDFVRHEVKRALDAYPGQKHKGR